MNKKQTPKPVSAEPENKTVKIELSKSFGQLLAEQSDYYSNSAARGHGGIPTGQDWFDNSFGGLCPGRMYIISGEAGVGKSTLLRKFAIDIAKQNRKVSLMTLEMHPAQLATLIVCSLESIPVLELDSGKDQAAAERFAAACEKHTNLPITITGGPMTPSLFQEWATQEVAQGSELICLDYIQMLQAEDGKGDNTEEHRVSTASTAVLYTAISLNIPILVIANESSHGNLRHSGQLLYDCAGHIKLEKMEATGGLTVLIQKCRHSPLPQKKLSLAFSKGSLIEYNAPPTEVNPLVSQFKKPRGRPRKTSVWQVASEEKRR